MVKEALLNRVSIPADQVYRIRGEVTPQVAAEEYKETLSQVFGGSRPVFDLILLGLGEDGHTASLFPDSGALREEQRLVMANLVPRLQVHRITFTLPLINAANTVAFLVTDGSKAGVVKQVLEPAAGESPLSAALVHPDSGNLHWFLTKDVASELKTATAPAGTRKVSAQQS